MKSSQHFLPKFDPPETKFELVILKIDLGETIFELEFPEIWPKPCLEGQIIFTGLPGSQPLKLRPDSWGATFQDRHSDLGSQRVDFTRLQ